VSVNVKSSVTHI